MISFGNNLESLLGCCGQDQSIGSQAWSQERLAAQQAASRQGLYAQQQAFGMASMAEHAEMYRDVKNAVENPAPLRTYDYDWEKVFRLNPSFLE